MTGKGEADSSWYEGDVEEENEDYSFREYDITSSPNDFNINTIYDFIQSGTLEIPNFQRNYVWDIKRASKLIESLIMGLPVPQIFLYEQSKNHFLVIDGQQRLMTIYYFIKKRFPKKEHRVHIGRIFDDNKKIPDEILRSDEYFDDFNLKLPLNIPDRTSVLNGLNYSTLSEEHKSMFGLRTIRNVIIKQNIPPGDDSSIYEIFYRLNSGGMNLTSQEVRYSLYHSKFYELLERLNQNPQWRKMVGTDEDIRLKDVEVILRAFAMLLEDYRTYKPSMTKFLNNFSKKNMSLSDKKIGYLEKFFVSFLKKCDGLSDKAFYSKFGKFNISMFEAIFVAVCEDAFKHETLNVAPLSEEKIDCLKGDSEFFSASQSETASKANVNKRIERAKAILL